MRTKPRTLRIAQATTFLLALLVMFVPVLLAAHH
jgi:hypothetical protein